MRRVNVTSSPLQSSNKSASRKFRNKVKAGAIGTTLGILSWAGSILIPRENDWIYSLPDTTTVIGKDDKPYKDPRFKVAFAVGVSVALVTTFVAYRFFNHRSKEKTSRNDSDLSHTERLAKQEIETKRSLIE